MRNLLRIVCLFWTKKSSQNCLFVWTKKSSQHSFVQVAHIVSEVEDDDVVEVVTQTSSSEIKEDVDATNQFPKRTGSNPTRLNLQTRLWLQRREKRPEKPIAK